MDRLTIINENLANALEQSNKLMQEYFEQKKFEDAEILTKAKNQIISAIKNINKLF